jgi:hypothetical protein
MPVRKDGNTLKKQLPRAIAVIAFVVLGAAILEPMMSSVEQPKYRVVEKDGNIELRDYAPMIVAETEVSGEQYKALGVGFRVIADYIFGNNSSSQKVAMTAPVTQQRGEKIAMTSPVTQQDDGGVAHVRFVMPAGYTLESLPKPANPAVTLKEIGSKRYAAIRFSGFAGAGNLARHVAELKSFVSARHLKTIAAPTYAFYDPPWTLPFLRRNEVMVEIAA